MATQIVHKKKTKLIVKSHVTKQNLPAPEVNPTQPTQNSVLTRNTSVMASKTVQKVKTKLIVPRFMIATKIQSAIKSVSRQLMVKTPVLVTEVIL